MRECESCFLPFSCRSCDICSGLGLAKTGMYRCPNRQPPSGNFRVYKRNIGELMVPQVWSVPPHYRKDDMITRNSPGVHQSFRHSRTEPTRAFALALLRSGRTGSRSTPIDVVAAYTDPWNRSNLILPKRKGWAAHHSLPMAIRRRLLHPWRMTTTPSRPLISP
ncbi:hypothetical protein CALVIDRAFT_238970 [Calocera viscosa TUFC12733]|uniref:Uncharacterized protein n=1 Tax=Calocera viscosa (strain TUFC12733) TaxID=1330018 RepID=A0A167JLX2_CALVF|nr:hypothetical protein CALVIDRAFT_238970 [Calocera viscosa TUFC12733]